MPLIKIVRAHTAEAVVVAISVFTAAMLWLLYTVFTMNATLGAVGTKTEGTNKLVEDTNRRIDRIVAVLPDVRAKVAQEEVVKPIQAAVVVTEPKESSKGKWETAVHFVETAPRKRRTYVFTVKGPEDKTVAYLASGTAISLDSDAISFDSLSAMSSDIGNPITAPGFVVSSNSIAIRKLSPDFQKAFEEAIKSYQPSLSIRTANIETKTTSWEKLSDELKTNALNYEPN